MYNSATIFFTEGKMKKLFIMLMLLTFGSQVDAGDVKNGKLIAYTCTGCHGIKFYMNAVPSYHVPLLVGQNEAYLSWSVSHKTNS